MGDQVEFTVPDGYYPPFTVITAEDRTGWIIIATTISLSMVFISVVIRITVRSTFKHQYGLDDLLLGVGILCAVIYECVLLGATTKGLGKAPRLVHPADLESLQKCKYAVQILSVSGLGFAKGSVSAFVIRLTPVRAHRRYILCVVVTCILWSVLAMLLWALKCDLAHPWVYIEEKCTRIMARSNFICILDIVTELLIFSSTAMLMFNLQTSLANKAIVLITFGFRLPLIAFIVLRMVTFKTDSNTPNLTLSDDLYVVWTVAEVNYSLISASIPLLRPFFSGLNTHCGVGTAAQHRTSVSSRTERTRSNSYVRPTLQSLGKASRNQSLQCIFSSTGKGQSQQAIAQGGSNVECKAGRADLQEAYGQIGGVTESYAYHPTTPKGSSEFDDNALVAMGPAPYLTAFGRPSRDVESQRTDSEDSPRRMVITKHVSWHIHRDSADEKDEDREDNESRK